MPASRARTAICSAPLEWPSRPGLPTRKVSRRPSFRDTRSTSARMSSRPPASLRIALPTPVGARYSPKRLTQRPAPFAGGDAGFGAGDRGRHDVGGACGGALEIGQRRRDRLGVARCAPGFQPLDLVGFGLRRDRHDRLDAAGQRRRLGFQVFVDADHDLVAALDRLQPRGVGFDELLFHVAGLDRRDRAAHLLDAPELLVARRALSSSTLLVITSEPSNMSPYSSRSVS